MTVERYVAALLLVILAAFVLFVLIAVCVGLVDKYGKTGMIKGTIAVGGLLSFSYVVALLLPESWLA